MASADQSLHELYRHPDGHLKLPFPHLSLFIRLTEIRVGPAEGRALANTHEFVRSLLIIATRIRGALAAYRPDSWADVPYDQLFLDTQSLFLFVQQFLEDVALLLRMSFPHQQRQQLSPKFSRISRRLREVLPPDEPLKQFLDAEAEWFAEIADLRDDICHRTSFERQRTTVFPDLVEVMRAGGGVAPFASGDDLRGYLAKVFSRTLAFACVADEFLMTQLRRLHPDRRLLAAPGFIMRVDEIDFGRVDQRPQFPLGTTIMTVSPARLEALEYFLEPVQRAER